MTDTPVSLQFPANPSLEHLRKEAKEHLKAMRLSSGDVTLSEAQFRLARSYGFSSWRALKLEVDQRRQALSRRLPVMAEVWPGGHQGTRTRTMDPSHVEQTFFALCGLMFGLPTTAFILAVVFDVVEKIPL